MNMNLQKKHNVSEQKNVAFNYFSNNHTGTTVVLKLQNDEIVTVCDKNNNDKETVL